MTAARKREANPAAAAAAAVGATALAIRIATAAKAEIPVRIQATVPAVSSQVHLVLNQPAIRGSATLHPVYAPVCSFVPLAATRSIPCPFCASSNNNIVGQKTALKKHL